MSKRVFTSPIQAITDRPYSHRSGEAVMYADMLEWAGMGPIVVDYAHRISKNEGLVNAEAIYVHPGNDWSGALNLYGGLSAECPKALQELSKVNLDKTAVYSIPIPMPNYSTLIRDRLDKTDPHKVHPSWNSLDLGNLALIEEKAIRIVHPHESSIIVIGDSHAISHYIPGRAMVSVPYQTLHGALKKGLKSFIPDYVKKAGVPAGRLFFYFGNIDIRHHLLRQPSPSQATIDLATEYVRQAWEICTETNYQVVICEPLPIENESRKVPKSGYYKGTPFFGSWGERNLVRIHFTRCIEDLISMAANDPRLSLNRWTDYLLNSKGELDFAFMEKPQSIHLARSHWPYWHGPVPSDTPTIEEFF